MTRTFQPMRCSNPHCLTPWEVGFVSRPTGTYCQVCDEQVEWADPWQWPTADPRAVHRQTTRED